MNNAKHFKKELRLHEPADALSGVENSRINNLVRKKIIPLVNPYDTAKAGEILDNMDVSGCLGLVAYDPIEKKFYGAHLLYFLSQE